MSETSAMRVLVTGASGYVGGRLVPRLLERGIRVRCLARTPAKLDSEPWRDEVEVVEGEVGGDLHDALDGVDVAVYLVHGIGQGPDWVAKEIADAAGFGASAKAAGVGKIVYLGGLGDDQGGLSDHLTSRHEVGRALGDAGVRVLELRAAVILGSGSASFEMLRYLVEVLPVMVTPKWVTTRCQPIAISDVLDYLVASIEASPDIDGVIDIGGPDVVSYAEMMAAYAKAAGLRRRILIPVPVLTPRLSSHWVGLVTPVPAALARPLVDSLVNEVVVSDDRAIRLFGAPKRSLDDALRLALAKTTAGQAETSFTDADLQIFARMPSDPSWAGGTVLSDERVRTTTASAASLFNEICTLGGKEGWGRGEVLWRIRGLLDQLIGGSGLRRGRSASPLGVGDVVDFWRVEEIEADRRVVLRAEMVLPGVARLEWEIEDRGSVRQITQLARFWPRGLLGRAYWFSVAPFHGFVFPGLLGGIVGRAEVRDRRLAAGTPERTPDTETPDNLD